MADPLRIRIRDDWDAALTYDSLNDVDQTKRPVFVGRDAIIEPLVAEILEPNKRGTYLISGYRGTGKTTLLIEALIRSQKELRRKNYKLFPLVLNVSEIAASLGTVSADSPHDLKIDPRRLLIALLRTIGHRLTKLPDLADVTQKAHEAYEKATAAKYSQTSAQATEIINSRSREFATALEIKNLLNTVAVVAAGSAVVMELLALGQPKWVHAAALALGTVAVISITVSYRRASSMKSTTTGQTSIEKDNSLQQLETDLKDLLVLLTDRGLRTVVIMEELDKIDDEKGKQLAAVIRYFKNLFTQAPALFFFVTDKSYFDTIASAIKRARRKRSYAVEHTFFTHRVFVGRPTTRECLDYIAAIAANEADQVKIRGVASELGKPGRQSVDQLDRFIRVVLFNAANHLFDLKNELRRYARKEKLHGETVTNFLIDDDTFPPEAAALAVFQDLIVEKSSSFEIKGGRAYANETMADSLYAVFNELGSTRDQVETSFMPTTNVDDKGALLLDEQLDLNEAARVREAVLSLMSDLERGRAFQERAGGKFKWSENAARAFRYERRLQKHEENLIAELRRHVSLANALDPKTPHPLATDFESQITALRESQQPLNADEAASRTRAVADQYESVITEAFDALRVQLMGYGFNFDLIAKGHGGFLYLVKPPIGDPRLLLTKIRGAVLLAFGEMETLLEDVWSYISAVTSPSLQPLNRTAIVHVLHTASFSEPELAKRRQQWMDALTARARQAPGRAYTADVVTLVDPGNHPPLDQTERIVAALAGYGAWVTEREYPMVSNAVPKISSQTTSWLLSGKPFLHIVDPRTTAFRPFDERDEIEKRGPVVMQIVQAPQEGLAASAALMCMTAFGNTPTFGKRWDLIGEWLLSSGRVIPYADVFLPSATKPEDIIGAPAGTRQIIVGPRDLPPAFHQLAPDELIAPELTPALLPGNTR
ncbi:MAG TPA: P-loop NTPase fold protein [Pyrinomonadaceae bacterium]|nr:P-loop NTPase fold protein [Pyrinomonadaceae bacterium]